MRIKTITCHDVYNHGASLQAYALQCYLSDLGHEVEIIDYKPDYLNGHYKLWTVSNQVFNKPLVKQLYLLAKLPIRLVALRRKRKFDEFTRRYLHLTRRYHSNEELKTDPPVADVYVAGSDQIWNTLFKNGRDPAFYLDFAPKKTKRISYAASFSTECISKEYKPFVQRMLQGFDAISIRERSSLPLLESLGRLDGVAVYDPVYLLSREQWNSLLPPSVIEEKYLLVYDTEHSEKLKNVAIRIAREKNLKIYNVSGFRLGYADKEYWASSPIDFVRLIRDAQYIISNSFHATSFSIIFQKDFCVINRSESINERMVSLLNELGLSDRMYIDDIPIILKSVSYSYVFPLLQDRTINSRKYLEHALKQ